MVSRINNGLLILLATFLLSFFAVQFISWLNQQPLPNPAADSSLVRSPQKPHPNVWGNKNIDVTDLCKRLREIKTIPYDPNETAGDPIYDGLRAAGGKAVPCLIEKLTDTERIELPDGLMPVNDFFVGDAATFMLLYITRENWQPTEMFPPRYAEMFKNQGVYAYYAYVEKPANRKKFQLWWKAWVHKTNGGTDLY
jgi:hypothetical protein